jgi:hypothetical protein
MENSYIPQNTANLTSLPVVYKRLSPLPLDETSIFSSLADAEKYALGTGVDSRGFGVVSYPGQIISVYEKGKVSVYTVQADKTLKEVGSGVEALTVDDYTKLGEIQEPVLGQIVKVTNKVTTSEGEYLAGIYIYNGSSFDRLGTSTGNVDEIAGLKSDIETIENNIKSIKTDIYDTDAEGNPVLDVYTKSEADTKLSDTLKDYATTSEVNTKLEGYATTSKLTEGLAEKLDSSDLESYKGEVSTTYATKEELTDGLAEKSDSTHNHDDKYAALGDFNSYKEKVDGIGTYTIKNTGPSGDYSAVYQLVNVSDDGKEELIGAAINIPKDMVVQRGEVVELNDGEVEDKVKGTYIKLVLNNDDILYINATDLVDVYTGSDYIGVNNYQISVDVTALAGKLATEAALTDKFLDKQAYSSDKETLVSTLEKHANDAAGTAKTEAIADIDKKLEGYVQTDTLDNYVKAEDYNKKVEELAEGIQGNTDTLETVNNIVTSETIGNSALSTKLGELETELGKTNEAVEDNAGAIETINGTIEALEKDVVTTIKIGDTTCTKEDNTVTIDLASDVNVENGGSLIPSVKAVSDAIKDINSGKASISVGDLPAVEDAKTNVIYISGAEGSRKETIKIEDSFYELGSDTYATKVCAEAYDLDHTGKPIGGGVDGLMSAADKTRLDMLQAITTEELLGILENTTVE